MKGRERNTAFFQQNGGNSSVRSGAKPSVMTGRGGADNNIKTLLKNGRSSGSVVLVEKNLTVIPPQLFSVEQDLEEGEKFWYVC